MLSRRIRRQLLLILLPALLSSAAAQDPQITWTTQDTTRLDPPVAVLPHRSTWESLAAVPGQGRDSSTAVPGTHIELTTSTGRNATQRGHHLLAIQSGRWRLDGGIQREPGESYYGCRDGQFRRGPPQIHAGADWPEDAAADTALVDFLIERRNRIGHYWFDRLNPLDDFRVENDQLHFTDLARSRGYAEATGTQYDVRILNDQGATLEQLMLESPVLPLQHNWPAQLIIDASPQRASRTWPPVRLYLQRLDYTWKLLGLRRL